MDVAALALNIDSSSVVKAANDLDRFAASSDKATASSAKFGAASGNQSGSIAKLVASVQSMDSKLSSIVGSLDKIASATRAASAANDNMATSATKAGAAVAMADAHVIAYTQHLAGMAAAQRDANAHVLAYQQQLRTQPALQADANAHVLAYRDSLSKVADGAKAATTSLKFTAREGLNASRQLADIGVTAAMGMNPFLIALQQGPQLFDILQEKAIATGTSISAVFRAAAVSIAASLIPLAPFIIAIGLVAAGIAALTAQANDDSGLKKYTTAMGYTKAEVLKLNAVTVTFGDTTKAVFQVGLRSVADAMGLSVDEMAKTWDSFLDHLVSGTRAALAGIYAGFAGTRAYLGEIEKGGILGIGKMLIGQGDPKLLAKTYGKAYADGQAAIDAVIKQAQANARGRQTAMAKGMYDAPAGGAAKTDPLTGIMQSAQNEIDVEKARAAAIGMSARAAAELEQRTKLLNQIQKAGIPITDGLRAKIGELSQAYADAKIAADKAVALQSVSDDAKKQSDAINDQLTLVGLYGDALIRARVEMEALAKARELLPKGESLSSDEAARIYREAKPVADDQINLDRQTRMAKVQKDAEDAAFAMDLERGAIGLTGAAALEYAFIAERLNEAKRAGIDLSPAEVAAIEAAGEAYATQRHAIDQQKQAMADAREVTRGFFSDFINGVREGGNIFKSFADSVVNSLNRIIDKLLDKALDGFLDNMFAGGGGGGLFGSIFGGGSGGFAADPRGRDLNKLGVPDLGIFHKAALGGVYGAQRFAKGRAFTNSVVNTPTLFRFANGAALGEMGEAGPEAIMPLKRGPNGALGVQSSGGKPSVRMGDVYMEIKLEGAMMPETVVAIARQAGQQAVSTIRKDFASIAAEYETNGVVSA